MQDWAWIGVGETTADDASLVDAPEAEAAPVHEQIVNLPNTVSLLGYASSIAWIAGGSPWYAALGLLADEFDGDIARATGQTTLFGAELDWAIDIALAAVIAVKLGGMWLLALPVITGVQAFLRSEGTAPAMGSARAVMTVIAFGV